MDAIFFPRNDYPNNVEICKHRFGKTMTYTENTDTLRLSTSYDWFLEQAKQRNIKVSAFAWYTDFKDASFYKAKQDYDNGDLWLDIYALCPTIEDKIVHGDTISQEEWNEAYYTYLLPSFMDALGKKPLALAASYGNITYQDYVVQMLAIKNSIPQSELDYSQYPTNYGIGCGSPNNIAYSFSGYHSMRSTTRWFDNAVVKGAKQDPTIFNSILTEVSNNIDLTLQNGGWFHNFTHWHNVYTPNNPEIDYRTQYSSYFDILANKNANGDIYFAGYGEAVAYLVYRQLITKAVMYSPVSNPSGELIIRLEAQNTLGIDADLLQIPISVKFSTIGTPLAGKTLSSKCNLVNLGSGDYIVEIPYTGRFPYAVIKGN